MFLRVLRFVVASNQCPFKLWLLKHLEKFYVVSRRRALPTFKGG